MIDDLTVCQAVTAGMCAAALVAAGCWILDLIRQIADQNDDDIY
jgi:hypothetical protein